MNDLHVCLLVKNEANRYLERLLNQVKHLSNRIVVLDDNSSDNTIEICKNHNCEVYESKENMWENNELEARKKLWELTIEKCNDNDWIMCIDADELMLYSHLEYLRWILKTTSNNVNGIGFRLYDMWSDTHFRDDELWCIHNYYYPLIVRYKSNFNYEWYNKKPLHCGRLPSNSALSMLPTEIPIQHMGWAKVNDRIFKYNRYMRLDYDGKYGNFKQYASILDPSPNLKLFGSGIFG